MSGGPWGYVGASRSQLQSRGCERVLQFPGRGAIAKIRDMLWRGGGPEALLTWSNFGSAGSLRPAEKCTDAHPRDKRHATEGIGGSKLQYSLWLPREGMRSGGT
jgi:hypothetical protein